MRFRLETTDLLYTAKAILYIRDKMNTTFYEKNPFYERKQRLRIESHNFVSFAFRCEEDIRGDFRDVSGVLMHAYRRRCHRRRRRAPLWAAARSTCYFRAIFRRLTKLRDHTWAPPSTTTDEILHFRRKQSPVRNSFHGSRHSCNFCGLYG